MRGARWGWVVLALGLLLVAGPAMGGTGGGRRGWRRPRPWRDPDPGVPMQPVPIPPPDPPPAPSPTVEREQFSWDRLQGQTWRAWDPGVTERQRLERFRVAQTIWSGILKREVRSAIGVKQRELAQVERNLRSDAPLSAGERLQLRQAVEEVCAAAYSEDRSGEGRPPLNALLLTRIDVGDFSAQDAGELFRQVQRIYELRRIFGSGQDLTPDQRTALLNETAFLVANLHAGWRVWDPGVNDRQRHQRFRIVLGIKSGSLTKEEAEALAAKEKEIGKLETDLKADGKLTLEERRQLQQALNDVSRLIYAEKQNQVGRPIVNRMLTAKINSNVLDLAGAGDLLAEMRRACELRRILAGEGSVADRAALEAELLLLAVILHE